MFFETIPYISVFIIILYNIYSNSRYSNQLAYLALFILSALRYNVGYDYMGYMETIQYGKSYSIERYEIGERLLLLLSRETFPQLFFIANSFISILFIKLVTDKLSKNIGVSILAFYCFPNMFLYSMGVVRYWSALAVIFYASTFLKDRKFIPYLIFQLLALLLHNGAIIGILFIPLYYIRIPKIVSICILIFAFVGGNFVFGQIISGLFPENAYSDKLLQYANLDMGSGMSKIPYLFLFFDLILLFGCNKISQKSKDFTQMVIIYNFGVAIMFLFSFQNTLSIRLSLPFLVYSVVLISYIIQNKISPIFTRPSKLLIFSSLCFALLMYNITIFNESLGKSQYLPYRLFFLN